MARVSSKDPLDKFRWIVEVDGFSRLGFTSVEVPSVSINVKNYAEGGSHLFPRKIIDGVTYSPIVLQRGATSDRSFHEWAAGFIDLLHNVEGVAGYRRNLVIKHLDRLGRVVREYRIYDAFPSEYKPASDFAADSDDTYSLERITLEYESFEVIVPGQENNAFNIKDLAKRLIRGI